jgi:hypothetical protein
MTAQLSTTAGKYKEAFFDPLTLTLSQRERELRHSIGCHCWLVQQCGRAFSYQLSVVSQRKKYSVVSDQQSAKRAGTKDSLKS